MSNRSALLIRATLSLILVGVFPILRPVLAQSPTGTISGTAVDSSGAVLSGVIVTLTHNDSRATRSVTTNEQGFFSAPLLAVGDYEIVAELSGFQTRRLPDVRLSVGQALDLRLVMALAGVAETVTVSVETPVVETSRTQVSSTVDETAINNLPVNGRNFIDFALLTPGVTKDTRTGDISFAGQRGTLNSLIIDGADNNNTFFGQTLGRTGSGRAPYQFSQDAVQEFQVNSNAYTAEYGRAGGAVINVVTRSGTNQFQGSVFEFFRDKALNSNDAINERQRLAKAPYHYHQFGGTLGGPIQRDRHFFFFNYDGQRNTQPNQVFLNIPDPRPTDPDSLAAIARLEPLAFNWNRALNQDVFLVKSDHAWSANRLTLRYNHQNFTGVGFEAGGSQRALEGSGDSQVRTRTLNAILALSLRPNLYNELKAQYARDGEPGTAKSDNPQATIRQTGATVLTIGRNFFSPRETTIKRWQFADNVTWVSGAHTVKTGVDLQFDRIFNSFPGNFFGAYTFDTLASFARGVPSTYIQAFAGEGTTGYVTHPDIDEYSFFAQDEWRLSSDLTFNLGIRYDMQKFAQPPVKNRDPQLAAAGIDTSVLNDDTNNWGPRIGLAWSPSQRSYVVRGGYGIFYGRTPSIMVGTAHSNNGINVKTLTYTGALVPTYPNKFSSPPTGGAAAVPTIFVFDPNYENARVQQASVGVETRLGTASSLAVNYIFVRGDQLPRSTDINIGPVSTYTLSVAGTGETFVQNRFGAKPFTNFDRIISFQSTAESTYNGFTLEFNRRFANSLSARVAYTLGKVEDTVPDATAVVPGGTDDYKFAPDPTNFEASRARGNNDQRHRFVFSGVYTTDALASSDGGVAAKLVRGWTLAAILTAQSGQPYSAYVNTDINGDGNRFNDLAPGTTRNEFELPSTWSLDPRVARDIPIGRARLQLIFEAFNVLNRANYTSLGPPITVPGNTVLYSVSGTTLTRNPNFGVPLGAGYFFPNAPGGRIMQVATKLIF